MHFSFDNYNNLYIRDYLNNIHIMYNPFLATQNNPGLISINNEYLDINANSFDLAVSANINSILINIRSFFNRVLVTNPTPFALNDGQNVINVTLKALDNTIKTITFNILKAPAIPSSPPIVLPGLDPNYVPPTSSAQSSSVASSSVINSSISSSSSTSSSSSSNNVITSSSSITGGDNTTNNEEENPLFIWIILGIPAIITLTILGYAQILKGRAKSKLKVEDKKEEVEIPNSGNKDNQ
jgi:cobalamin biosynthesis Mg chelatase CobN